MARSRKPGAKKQTTRGFKAHCLSCGYNVRLSRQWVSTGAPLCGNLGCENYGDTMCLADLEAAACLPGAEGEAASEMLYSRGMLAQDMSALGKKSAEARASRKRSNAQQSVCHECGTERKIHRNGTGYHACSGCGSTHEPVQRERDLIPF